MFDIVALSETWLEKEMQFERFRYFGVHRKKSKNGRTHGSPRLKSVSYNLMWLRVKADGRFIIFCAIYILPESSSYNEEET